MTVKDSPFEPLHDYLLVEEVVRREVGIILPVGPPPEIVKGFVIIKRGPGRMKDDKTIVPVPDYLQVGMEVILNNGACIGFMHPLTPNRKFVLVRPADVIAVVQPEKPMDETTKLKLLGPHQ